MELLYYNKENTIKLPLIIVNGMQLPKTSTSKYTVGLNSVVKPKSQSITKFFWKK